MLKPQKSPHLYKANTNLVKVSVMLLQNIYILDKAVEGWESVSSSLFSSKR